MIKAILFDFFGVIRTDSFYEWMNNHGYTREDEPGKISRAMDLGEISLDQFYDQLGLLTDQTREELQAEFNKSGVFNDQLISYIKELINDYKIALLSNSESKYLRGILSFRDLEKLFDEIIISAEVGAAKPDKEIFETALKKLGVAPEEAVFIDDQQKNIDAAKAVGIKGIRFQDLEQLKKDLSKLL